MNLKIIVYFFTGLFFLAAPDFSWAQTGPLLPAQDGVENRANQVAGSADQGSLPASSNYYQQYHQGTQGVKTFEDRFAPSDKKKRRTQRPKQAPVQNPTDQQLYLQHQNDDKRPKTKYQLFIEEREKQEGLAEKNREQEQKKEKQRQEQEKRKEQQKLQKSRESNTRKEAPRSSAAVENPPEKPSGRPISGPINVFAD